MCKCRYLLLPILSILTGSLLLISNYGYGDGYYVQTWWPILLVIAGASKLAKQFCCSKGTCSSEESKNSTKYG